MTLQKKIMAWGALAALAAALFVASAETGVTASDKGGAASGVVVTDFDDWRMECRAQSKPGAQNCRVFQKVLKKDNNKTVLAAILVATKEKKSGKVMPVMHLIAPLGVRLPPGAALRIDDGKQVNVPFQSCTAAGCSVDIKMSGEFLTKLKSGKMVRVAYQRTGAKPDTVGLSLKGFSKALDALTRSAGG